MVDYAKVPPQDIVVHVLPGVPADLTEALRTIGVSTAPLLPFGDGAYCNKIAQLASPALADADHVALMDTDTLVLEDIRHLADPNAVRAKIVDMANPPLNILKRIFSETALSGHPPIVPTDIENGAMTFSGNCNGGLYLIPQGHLRILGISWAKWALWLLDKPQLIGQRYQVHIDQVSFCLAVFETGVPFTPLERRFNFPTHLDFPKHERPAVLHYHRTRESDGRLSIVSEADVEYAQVVDRANTLILACKRTYLPGPAERDTGSEAVAAESLILGPAPLRTIWTNNIARIVRGHGKGPRVFLHMGTPKTGTTALQSFFAHNHQILHDTGIDYLWDFIESSEHRKHQQIFMGMSKNDRKIMDQVKDYILRESSQGVHTFLISAEGFYNYIQEFGSSYMQSIRELAKIFSVHLVVFLRPQCHFLESCYRQCLRNPRVINRQAYCSDLDIETFADLPWMANQLDYARNLRFLIENMGEASLNLVLYSHQAMRLFLELLSVPPDVASGLAGSASQLSLNRAATELLRMLNPLLLPKTRERLIKVLEEIATCSSISRDASFAPPAFMDWIMRQHDEGNRQVALTFWGRKKLFPEFRLDPDAPWTPPGLDHAKLIGLLPPLLNKAFS